MTLQPGQILKDRYEIDRLLGWGESIIEQC